MTFAAEDEDEKRQQQRRPDVRPLRCRHSAATTPSRMNSTPISRTFIGPVGTSRGCRMYRRTIAVTTTNSNRRDHPQHEDVLGHRQIDAEHRRQMDQRVIGRAVRDMANDVEPLRPQAERGDVLDPASSGVGPRSVVGPSPGPYYVRRAMSRRKSRASTAYREMKEAAKLRVNAVQSTWASRTTATT